MRIGHFLCHYPAPGSTTRGVAELAAGLARLGHEVVIYGCGRAAEAEAPPAAGVRVAVYPAPGPLPHYVPAELRKRIAANRDGLDLLVLHGLFSPALVPVARSARRAGIPCVACPRGLHHPSLLDKHRLRKRLYGWLFEKPLLERAAAIQVFDEYQTEWLRRYGVRRPAFIVRSGLEEAELAALPRRPRPPGEGLHLLYLGRIDAHTKGLDLLIRALVLGREAGGIPDGLKVSLVGPDREGDGRRLQRLAAGLGVERYVRFPGPVAPERRWEAVQAADLLLCPSRHDAFPRVVLEAMATGTPVFVSTNTGITSAVRAAGCGYVVEPEAGAIWIGMERALSERGRWASLGEAGRRYAYDHFTWERVAETAVRHYEEVLCCARAGDLRDPLPTV